MDTFIGKTKTFSTKGFLHLSRSMKGKHIIGLGEDGGKIGGSGVHLPLAPVKHLADLRKSEQPTVLQHI